MNFFYRIYDACAQYRKAVLVALIVFIFGFSVSVLFRGAIGEPYRTDVTVFLKAAQAAVEGTDIYDAKTERQWNYVYLPLLAILLKPFAYAPLWTIVLAWYYLSVAMLAGTVLLAARLKGAAVLHWRPAIFALVLSLPMMLNTLSRGQFGVFSVFFAMLCYFLYVRNRKWSAGIALAFAIVIKMSPVFFLLGFFVLERAWRVLIAAFIGLIFFVWILPGFAVGWSMNAEYLQTWFEAMRLATSKYAQQSQLWGQLIDPYAEDNQSFYAVLLRLFGPDRDQLVPGADAAIRWIARGFGLLLLALLSIISMMRQVGKSKAGTFLEYALLSVVMLYASPVSESHHYTVVYLMYAAAFYMLEQECLSRRLRKVLIVSVAFCASSMICGMIFDPLNYAGAFVWGSFVLWASLFGVHFWNVRNDRVLLPRSPEVSNRGGMA